MATTTTARKAPSAIAKGAARAAAASTASPVAGLAGKATTESATAPRAPGLKTGPNYTGQYLYDRFITGDKEEITKMDIVRDMVKAVDTQSFKALLKDFIGVAKGYVDNAVKRAQDAGDYDADNEPGNVVAARGRLKTAQNHQTVMRIGYGALKFAGDALESAGYNPAETGYLLMRVVGQKALADKGINWDGSKAESTDDRNARRRADRERKVMADVMAKNPMQDGESRIAYLTRIDELTNTAMEEATEQQRADELQALAARIKALAGDNLADVLDYIATHEDEPEAEGDNGNGATVH